jgi:hypothetical protein
MKGLRAAVAIFFLSAILIGSSVASTCAEMPVQVVESEGSSIIVGNDRARARNEAVRDALQKAVAQVAGLWLAPQNDTRKSDLLKEQIYGKAEGFIQDYRIISEVVSQDFYTVAIRASVLADAVRGDLRGLGLIGPAEVKRPLNRISLVIRGIRDYNGYSRCQGILREGKTGIREVILREASWGLARFDVTAETTVPILSEWLKEKMAVDIRHQDERTLEVDLR